MSVIKRKSDGKSRPRCKCGRNCNCMCHRHEGVKHCFPCCGPGSGSHRATCKKENEKQEDEETVFE